MGKSEMIGMELFSVLVNLLMLFGVFIQASFIRVTINNIIVNIGLWIMFASFILNTIGNLLSNNYVEKIVFTLSRSYPGHAKLTAGTFGKKRLRV